MLELGSKFLIAYLLGSIMGAIVVGMLRGGVDIRKMGSGNAGGTNALRTQGKLFALGVIVIDIGKGALAAGVVPTLNVPFIPVDPEISRTWLTLCCGAAAVIGHVWPVYHGFRGGKGAASYIGVLSVIAPTLLVPMLLAFMLVLVFTGFVGLSTMTAALVLPIWVFFGAGDFELFVFGLFMAGFIIYCHRANIQRMRDGNENQNKRVMLFRRDG